MLKGKNMTRVATLVSVVSLLALLVTACGGGPSVVGKWQDPDGITYEFTSDGKFLVSFGGESLEGTYSVSGNTLTLEFMGESTSGEFKVSGDTLTLIDPDGGSVDLTRVK